MRLVAGGDDGGGVRGEPCDLLNSAEAYAPVPTSYEDDLGCHSCGQVKKWGVELVVLWS